MRKLTELLKLLTLQIVVSFRNFFEYLRVSVRYYSNFKFCKVDHALIFTSFLHNPFSISKRYLKEKGEKQIYAYGETPLTTLDEISQKCGITKEDVVFELGSGRGRACFWLNLILGCRVVGIEMIPAFVQRAEQIRQSFHLEGIEFRNENMLESDFSGATVFYLYGTTFDDSLIEKLTEKLEKMPPGTKVISVSYPITDYTGRDTFELMRRFTASFTWGCGEVYLQIRK